MATMLEEYTEEQRPFVLFYGQKDSVESIFIKKSFLFTVGSICHVKWFTTGSRHMESVSLMMKRFEQVQKWLRQHSKRLLCCRFRHTGKAMG
jgi:hypothetical protein